MNIKLIDLNFMEYHNHKHINNYNDNTLQILITVPNHNFIHLFVIMVLEIYNSES